jgi:hypothetical protein
MRDDRPEVRESQILTTGRRIGVRLKNCRPKSTSAGPQKCL